MNYLLRTRVGSACVTGYSAAKCRCWMSSIWMLNFSNSGDADPRSLFEFFASEAKLLDLGSDDPGEFCPVFRVSQFSLAFAGLVALAFSFTCHEKPPRLATRTSWQIADIASHAKPQRHDRSLSAGNTGAYLALTNKR